MLILTKTEIEELKSIHDYLNSENPTIATLGFNLYKSNYADKFAFHIIRPREWSYSKFFGTEHKIFVCEFRDNDNHVTVHSNLAHSIYDLLYLYGYDPFK